MKRILSLIITAVLVLTIVPSFAIPSFALNDNTPYAKTHKEMGGGEYNGFLYHYYVDNSVNVEAEISPENSFVCVYGYKADGKVDSLTIPDSINGYAVKAIGSSKYWNIRELVIPEGVIAIERYAFQSDVDKVYLPSTLEYVGDSAFVQYYDGFNTSGMEIVLPEQTNISYIGKEAFLEGTFESFSTNAEKLFIGEKAFAFCQSMKNFTAFSKEITVEESDIFQYTTVLENIYTPNLEIFNGVYTQIYSKEAPFFINLPQGPVVLGKVLLFHNGEANGDIVIPDGINQICTFAFKDLNLTSLTTPKSLKYIELGAFSGCSKLKTIKLNEGLIKIGKEAFLENISLVDFSFPSTLTEIGEKAFYYCKSLTKITFPSALKVLDDSCFEACISLSSVTLPAKIERIGERAFYNCPFTEILILSREASLGRNCFGCVTTDGVLANSVPTEPSFVVKGYLSSSAMDYANYSGVLFHSIDGTEDDPSEFESENIGGNNDGNLGGIDGNSDGDSNYGNSYDSSSDDSSGGGGFVVVLLVIAGVVATIVIKKKKSNK